MSSTQEILTFYTGPRLEPEQVATGKVMEGQAEAKKELATAHQQNGDIQIIPQINEITRNIDPNSTIDRKPNRHLPHAIEINGGPELEVEADKISTNLVHQVNEPYQAHAPSTSSIVDAKPTAYASPMANANPLVDVEPEINGPPVTDANPVEESNQVGDPTAVAGNHGFLVDSSTTTGLKPTAGEVSQTYTAEGGITNKVAETRAEPKV